MQHWTPLAEQGHARAQFNLGQMYRLGLGVTTDDQQAAQWYMAAADAELPQARHNLALMRLEGRLQNNTQKLDNFADTASANVDIDAASFSGLNIDAVNALPAQHILIQLIASPQRSEVEHLLQAYQGKWPQDPLLARTESKGRLWYVLLLGPYPDQTQADRVLASLPQAIKQHKPWFRTVASLQATVR